MVQSKIIVWDLVDVLFEAHRLSMGMHIVKEATGSSLWNMLKIIKVVPSEAHMKQMMHDVLKNIPSSEEHPCFEDDEGVCISKVHCDYLACKIASQTVREDVKKSINHLAAQGYFTNELQQKLVAATLDTVFTPKLYAYYMRPIRKGIALLKQCAEKRTAQGALQNQMMILSNWDCESFPYLLQEKANQAIFKYFTKEHIFISGQFESLDALKPCTWIFNYLIDYKNVKPSDFVLIDNSPANIAAAQAVGMHAILLQKNNYATVAKELKKLGVL